MANATLKLDAERDWWGKWRRADYSWEGLGRKRLRGWVVTPDGRLVPRVGAPEGAQPATLKDYWSDEEKGGHLIEGDGKRWTRIHCPLEWLDGSPTPKAQWSEETRSRVTRIVIEKLGAEGPEQEGGASETDRRPQLQGAILVDPVELDSKGINAEWSAFIGPLQSYVRKFVDRLNFENSCFFSAIEFRNAEFENAVSFNGTLFLGRVTISNSSFTGLAHFNKAQFHASADYTKTTFQKPAEFRDVVFNGTVWFNDATFAQQAQFNNAQFQGTASFSHATFRKAAIFDWAEFHKATYFNGPSEEADGAQFEDTASFRVTKFVGATEFSRARFANDVNYHWARFCEPALWENAEFTAEARFERCSFESISSFCEAVFKGNTVFEHAEFRRRARFQGTKFLPDGGVGAVDFNNCRFAELADFNKAEFPARCEQFSGAFLGAMFGGVANFRCVGSHWIAALDGAAMEGKLLLDPPTEVEADKIYRKDMLRGAREAWRADAAEAEKEELKNLAKQAEKNGGKSKKISETDRKEWRRDSIEKRLAQLEGGFRVAKLAMGRDRNEVLEQRFYRFQLLTRRQRRDTLPWERAASHLYALASDYGASMARPIVWITVLTILFAGAYWSMGVALDAVVPNAVVGVSALDDAWAALVFSWSNTFRPLSALSSDSVRSDDGSWIAAMLYSFGAGPGFGVRALATLQSLLAIALAFLFALAVRRRFQIG